MKTKKTMKIKTTTGTIFILTAVLFLFFGLGFNLLDFNFESEIILAQSFTCDSGSLGTTCYINTPHNITGETISGSGNLEIQNGGNLYTDQGEGTTAIINMMGNVEVKFGGKIEGNIDLTAINLIIESGASINANGKGHGSESGPGRGEGMASSSSTEIASGAGYGGIGGCGWWGDWEGGPTYGSLTEPIDIGSGGGGITLQAHGGWGGGAIKLDITGTLKVDGSITSNGGNGISDCGLSGIGKIEPHCGGGGSGGSIWIIADTFTGSGSIIANGGSGTYIECQPSIGGKVSGKGSGAGGGRIGIDYKNINFNGHFRVDGGAGDSSTARNGQQGSIYIASSDDGKVKIKNSPAIVDVYDLHIERCAFIDAIITNNGITIPTGKSIKGNVEISASNLTIESGASINADEKGYGSENGPGRGEGRPSSSSKELASGAGYGGIGGCGWWGDWEGGPTYGSLTEPIDIGSGGGGITLQAHGGWGGGAIKLDITGTLKVDGSITSNGGNGISDCGLSGIGKIEPHCGGGGSGGSIWIIADTLAGGGSIIANGGSGGTYIECQLFLGGKGSGAGGGRIGIDCCEITHTGTITVTGGTGYNNGEDGTINYGPCTRCALEGEDCSLISCCPLLSCVDHICRSCLSLNCSADDAEDNSISEMGDAIDDVYCSWNIHDGCLVKEGVETVNGCQGIPSYWEPESCGGDGGTSDLWGEKKVYIDDINDYNIKVRCGVDDSAQVWINGSDSEILCNLSDDISLMADYNGDGTNDIIVFRNGQWLIDIDRNQTIDISFWYGAAGDIPLMADYNGDGTNDIIVFRNGAWYIDTDRNQLTDISFWYGIAGDIPLMADYNGDGTNDTIVFRNGEWIFDTNRDHITDIRFHYGIAGDIPLMADYNGDGTNDIIAFRNGAWYIDTDRNQLTDISFWYGIAGDIPLMADYNGDGTEDIIVFRNGLWYIDTDRNQTTDINFWSWADVAWSWTDATDKFINGWNTIKFKAIDFCGDDAWGSCGGRWFDLNWEIKLRAPALNGNAISFSEIKLTWDDRGTGATYHLWSFDEDDWIYHGTDIESTHSGLDANTTYSYKIMATKNGYDSDWSNTASATTWNQLPVAGIKAEGYIMTKGGTYSMVLGDAVKLSSESNDPDGDDITYRWDYVPFLNNLVSQWYFDEGLGNVAYDTSGVNNNDGTLKPASPIWTTGKVGNALSFDGVDNYVDILMDVPEYDFSIGLWIKTSLANVGVYNVTDGIHGAGGHDRHFYLNGDGKACFRVWTGAGWCTDKIVNDDNWHHVVLTVKTGIGQKAYIDGVLEGINAYDHSDFNWQDRFEIGYSADKGFFNGIIDEVKIYNKALSVYEIENLYKFGNGTLIVSSPESDPLFESIVFNPETTGFYSFTLNVTDIYGGFDIACISIQVADPPPVCGNDAVEGSEECDGTDKDACGEQYCIPAGQPGECTCQKPMPKWKEVHPKN